MALGAAGGRIQFSTAAPGVNPQDAGPCYGIERIRLPGCKVIVRVHVFNKRKGLCERSYHGSIKQGYWGLEAAKGILALP